MISNILQQNIEQLPTILSIQETADFLAANYRTVLHLIHAERLPAWKDDEGNWCIARMDLKVFCIKNVSL